MDPQIRNLKDFLQLYNKISEMCFSRCVDNFYNREISENETECVDKCLQKYARVNQRVMNVYVEVQTEINKRRMTEMEALTREQQAKVDASLSARQSNNISSASTSEQEGISHTPTVASTIKVSTNPSEVEAAR